MRASTSRKRSIVTPHPTTVALIQSSYRASRPVSSRRLRSNGKYQFSTELDAQIQEQLNECETEFDQNQIYRNAFSVIIEKYQNYALPMNLIKFGYDNLIDKLLNEIQKNQKQKESTLKTQTEFQHLLDIQKSEIQNKNLHYRNLSQQLHEQIDRMILLVCLFNFVIVFSCLFHKALCNHKKNNYIKVETINFFRFQYTNLIVLTHEVNDLSTQLSEIEECFEDENSKAKQNWSIMQEYVQRCIKKEAKSKKLNEYHESLEQKQEEINQAIQELQNIISITLDSIHSKERKIKVTNNSINTFKENIDRQSKLLEEKKASLMMLQQKQLDLTNSVKHFEDLIENANTENTAINNYLNKVMKLNSVSANSEVSDILGLTRRFASTLRPRRQVQDEATSTS